MKGADVASRRRQQGIAAIEFAILFPVFFLICYAIVTYSLLFVGQQTLTLAAEEGARSAVAYQPASSVATALSLRQSSACSTVANVLPSLTANSTCTTTVSTCASGTLQFQCLQVSVAFNYAAKPFVAPLPGLPTPAVLRGTATVQLNPATLTSS
jgi:Flp pilus assembly protein TadG